MLFLAVQRRFNSLALAFGGTLVLAAAGAYAQPQSNFQLMCLRQNSGNNRTFARASAELGGNYRMGGGGADTRSTQYVFMSRTNQGANESCYVYTDPSGRVTSASYAPY